MRLFVELNGVLDQSPDPGYRYLLFDREGTRRYRHHCCFRSGQELRLPSYEFMVIDAFERSAPAIIRCEDLAPGENTIALEPGAILEGTVVDAEGNPVHGATVVANLEGVPSRWDTTATTGQGGRFRLGGLPRDSEEVIVYPRSEDGRRSGDRVRRPNYAERLVLVLR